MKPQNDLILTRLTVRLKNSKNLKVIGSGIIYSNQSLNNNIYIITAAHCLYEDTDNFKKPYSTIDIDLYDPKKRTYSPITHTINYNLVHPDTEKDIAVLVIERSTIESITNNLPQIEVLKDRQSVTSFVLKGFPEATKGEEIVCIYPDWVQDIGSKFQLLLNSDFSTATDATSRVSGFSGSGVCLHSNNALYLFGIFTRFRDSGKVIYCQYIERANELLERNYLPGIRFTFHGERGLTADFFKNQVATAVTNLGPRFNEKLNFRLPIAKVFNEIAKDVFFKHRVLRCFDKWLTDIRYRSLDNEDGFLKKINEQYKELEAQVRSFIEKIDWNAGQKLDMTTVFDGFSRLDEAIDVSSRILYEKQREDIPKTPHKAHSNHDIIQKRPYEDDLNYLSEISKKNYQFIKSLEEINFQLANFPCLIIKGEAGCGKSHLLGDVAKERINRELPTILLLGQLFKKEQSVWKNIESQLGVSITQNDFLEIMNNIGKQKGTRLLILIDALNEGAGKELWFHELSGFITEISKYTFIGLVLTVRSTYFNSVINNSIQSDPKVTCITHQGFKGNEYEALRLYCSHYNLEQPNFPLLTPELTNPLFLQLMCEGIVAVDDKTFPLGFQGVSKIFDYYLKAVYLKLCERRDEYTLKPKIVRNAIEEIAKCHTANIGSRHLTLDNTIELFQVKFSQYPNLLNDLIYENILTRSLSFDYKKNEDVDIIYFAYERFGDFVIAELLLKKYPSKNEVIAAFKKGNDLGNLIVDPYWANNGVLEAIAILLPEKYKIEIFEVFSWVFKKRKIRSIIRADENAINIYFLDSLKWRLSSSINDEKVTKWLNSLNFEIDQDSYFYRLIELTIIPGHAFNSDRLYRILNGLSMAQRDSVWQRHVNFYTGNDDYGNAYPLTRLIDWAWQPGISSKVEPEIARLAAQTLSWVLSSTHRGERDRTTKAMVNLLEEQPEVLINILKAFQDVGDLYINERLYAVTYGCALRTTNKTGLQKIAQFVFDTIFKDGNPPNHILLRDYARNIVEYAIYNKLSISGDMSLIQPPYRSSMPETMPTPEEVEKYKMDNKAEDFRRKNGFANNRIHHSVMSWDFGRYTIDSAVGRFEGICFTMTVAYKSFLKEVKRKEREMIKLLDALYKYRNVTEEEQKKGERMMGKESYDKLINNFNSLFDKVRLELLTSLNASQRTFFKNKIEPYFESLNAKQDRYRNSLPTLPIRCWIVKRAYELGYDAKMHGDYDSSVERYNQRTENRIERIGKKYQWIAFHEILAMISDNYKVNDGYGSNSKSHYYQGPWEMYLRDIDPSFVTKTPDDEREDELGIVKQQSEWWLSAEYQYWNQPIAEWIKNSDDLSDPIQIIERTDELNQEWLYLNLNIDWNEPKLVGYDKFNIQRKVIWYMLNGYLVKKTEKSKIIKWLQQQNFRGRWMPEKGGYTELINRESFWSPAYKQLNNKNNKWRLLDEDQRYGGLNYKVIVSIHDAVGEFGDDQSGAHFQYNMPCQTLFEGMKLQYSSKDGEFMNESGDVVVRADNPKGVLIKKSSILDFLEENKLDIVWTLLGEKQAFKGFGGSTLNMRSTISGVYYLDNDKTLSGSLYVDIDRD